MLLPSLKRLFTRDFPIESQPMVEQLSTTINSNFEILYEAMSGKIEFGTNIKSVTKDLDVSVTSDGTPKNPTAFLASSNGRITGCVVVKAENLTNTTSYVASTPFISYSQLDNRITIANITGLEANDTYRLRIIAIG